MSQTTLYLTAGEKQLFDTLSDALKEGWTVEIETLTYQDDHDIRQVRLDLMRLDNGQFEKIILECGPDCSAEKLQQLAGTIDLTALSDHDLWEMFFALGPDAIGYLIAKLLVEVETDEQLEAVTALTFLRHELLISLQ